MNFKYILHLTLTTGLLLSYTLQPAQAVDTNSIVYASPCPVPVWLAEKYGKNFVDGEVLQLQIDGLIIVAYSLEKTGQSTLSTYQDNSETILWQAKDLGLFMRTVDTPAPLLVACYLDDNDIPDLFFSYSLSEGIGYYNIHWQRQMKLFIDCKAPAILDIPLSGEDSYWHTDTFTYSSCSSIDPAHWQSAYAILKNARPYSIEILVYSISGTFIVPQEPRDKFDKEKAKVTEEEKFLLYQVPKSAEEKKTSPPKQYTRDEGLPLLLRALQRQQPLVIN